MLILQRQITRIIVKVTHLAIVENTEPAEGSKIIGFGEFCVRKTSMERRLAQFLLVDYYVFQVEILVLNSKSTRKRKSEQRIE